MEQEQRKPQKPLDQLTKKDVQDTLARINRRHQVPVARFGSAI